MPLIDESTNHKILIEIAIEMATDPRFSKILEQLENSDVKDKRGMVWEMIQRDEELNQKFRELLAEIESQLHKTIGDNNIGGSCMRETKSLRAYNLKRMKACEEPWRRLERLLEELQRLEAF